MAAPTKKDIKVAGHLEKRLSKNGKKHYAMMLSWTDENGERQRKSKATGLLVKGNNKRAERMLDDAIEEQEALLNATPEGWKQGAATAADAQNASEVLFADFIEKDWLEAVRRGDIKACKRKVKPTTFGGYQLNVQTAIVPFFRKRGTLLASLTSDDINELYDFHFERGVSAKTVINYHANIVSSLKYAARKGYIGSAESILKNVLRPDAEDYVAKPYNEAEVLVLAEAVKGHRLELGTLISAYYGMRRSEVVGLRWESVDFDANTISIEHTVTVAKIDGKRHVVAKDTVKRKSSYRTLPLVPIMRAKLLEVKEEQEANRKLCGRSYNEAESAYICTDALGNRIKPDYISSEFPEFLKKHGLRRIRFHDLRHSCARLLLAAGVSLKAIQEWLGHSTFKTTADIYARFDGSSNEVSAKALTWLENTSFAQGAPASSNGKHDEARNPLRLQASGGEGEI